MAEKAIRLGGESTAAAITQTVDGLYPEHKFNEADFTLKHNDDEIAVDSNFAAQSFWKDARIRFLRKKSAVLGLILIVFIVLLAIFGPGMNSYTYSGQELSQKNFAPRVPGIEQLRHSGRQREDEHHHWHQDRQQLRRKRQGRCVLLVRQRPVWP